MTLPHVLHQTWCRSNSATNFAFRTLVLFFGLQVCGCNWLFGIEPPERQYPNTDGGARLDNTAKPDEHAGAENQPTTALGSDVSNASTNSDGKRDAATGTDDLSASPTTDSSSEPTRPPSFDASAEPPLRPWVDAGSSFTADASGGEPCGPDGWCAEGRCQPALGGAMICCAASCDSACKSCSTDGASCVDEVDDPACGVITCPADNACRKYTTQSVESERCLGGTCGAPEALCSFTARGEGRECSATHLCDALGNCTAPKLALGAACDSPDQCTKGFCVDGVCCDGPCAGPCMQCRAGTGACDVVPDDEPMCSDVSCENLTTECATSLGDITADHCKALGACKTFTDCATSAQPKGTPCGGYPHACDGGGECAYPAVDCGASSCETGWGNVCCAVSSDPAVSAPQCIADSDPCLAGFSDWELRCDEQSDCRNGEEICCAVVTNSGGGSIQCTAPESCNLYEATVGVSIVELCESPRMERQACSSGVACSITSDTLPGFTFCRLP